MCILSRYGSQRLYVPVSVYVHVCACICSQRLMCICDCVGDTYGSQRLRCTCVLSCVYAYRSHILKSHVFFNYS